ncbi:TspO/MBR family protein [Amphibacillus jilinensis]|uniref:TspO/MBR family protein n=1 Tax=Amphibacillus jilinensis TaxID=1216008 RepID=UPI0002E2658D|nr:TspO/MBR family protein [Amphibacillus jilinensis]
MKKFWLNVFFLVAVIVVNALANILPINGLTTGMISDRLTVLFTPAGYVFSIWSVIYLTLAIWVSRQWPEHRRNLGIYLHTHYLFWLTCILNITWILLWHYLYFGATVIVMLTLLVSLIVLYKKVQRRAINFLDLLPFSIYLAWISVATITNISYYLVEIGWDRFGISDQIWTIGLLVASAGLAIGFRYLQNDLIYPLVFVWAILGVGVENQGRYPVVSSVAYIVVGVIVVMLFIARRKHRFNPSS